MSLGTDILLKIRSTYDGKALDEATKKTKELSEKAAQSTTASAEKSAGAFTKISDAVRNVSSRMEIVNKLMSGLGITGIIGSVIAAAMRLKQKFDEIAEAARKVKLDKISADNEKAVKGLTTEYAALLKTIDAVNQATLRQRELEAARLKNKRDMEDVQADMNQQDELDKLDRNDPLYSEKAGEVRARFKSMSVERQSGREAEDVQIKATLAGDKIRDLRKQEEAARQQAEKTMAVLISQQNQIAQLETPVINRRDVYRSAGSGLSVKVGEEQYQDEAATKQNQEAAKKLREKLPDLAKSATEDIAKADDIGNQIVQAAQIASTIFDALRVAQQKAGLATRTTAAERSEAYRSTDKAMQDLSNKTASDGIQQEIDRKENDKTAFEDRNKELVDRATRSRDIRSREAGEAGKVYGSYLAKGDKRGTASALVELNQRKQELRQAEEELLALMRESSANDRAFRDELKMLKEQQKRTGQ